MHADRSDAFGHWLAGFIDGEGCFGIDPCNNGRGHYSCRFTLKLRADDADILREIHRRLGIGRLSRPRIDNGATSTIKACPVMRWTVNNKADCVALVALLDRCPLRAKKAGDYALWREAVIAWQSVERATGRSPASKLAANRRTWAAMARLREQLLLGRVYRADEFEAAPVVEDDDPQLFRLGSMS